MKTALFVAILSLATSALARPYELEQDIDNELYDVPTGELQFDADSTLDIISPPKKDIYYPAEPIEAECRAFGSPVPTVEWVLGSGSSDNNDFESNSITEMTTTGAAEVIAKLIVKPHHAKPGTTKTFTCIARSAGKVEKASTTVHFSSDIKHHLSSRLLPELIENKKPKIYEHYGFLYENIGSNVVLPCRATENAQMSWIDIDEKQIKGQSPRFKVLPTGELLIKNIQFSDMGTYICVAKNSFGRSIASTFLYPILPGNK